MMLAAANAAGQDTATPQKGFSEAIQDNSFFIEEAYNQEVRVVQHISNGIYFAKPQKDFAYSFTQEWPLFSETHQISFTIPYLFLNSNTISGIADVLINYRYQLLTKDDWAAVAPRVSVILPTGNVEKSLGMGVAGLQVSFPISKRLSESFAAHFNTGFTLYPNVKGTNASGGEIKQTLTSYLLGASLIWLAETNYNIMLEYATNFSSELDENGDVARTTEIIVSPGFRYAIDIGDLQIVPGIGVPFSFSHGDSRIGVFLYLSFEHPF